MTTDIKEDNGRIVVTFQGRLDTAAAVQVERDMQPLFQCKDTAIELDCSQLEYISSSGLRLFLMLLKTATANNTKVSVANLNGLVSEVFEETGFNNLFNIH